jgi:hypothetical protein
MVILLLETHEFAAPNRLRELHEDTASPGRLYQKEKTKGIGLSRSRVYTGNAFSCVPRFRRILARMDRARGFSLGTDYNRGKTMRDALGLPIPSSVPLAKTIRNSTGFRLFHKPRHKPYLLSKYISM